MLVRFSTFGVDQSWIVECKKHRRRICKADVETLKSIVSDTGVDRGFILSDSGFQPAAVNAARRSNVHLASFEMIQLGAEPEVRRLVLTRYLQRCRKLSDLIMSWQRLVSSEIGPDWGHEEAVVPRGATELLGVVSILQTALQRALDGKLPCLVPVPDSLESAEYSRIDDVSDLMTVSGTLVAKIEAKMRRVRRQWLRESHEA